MPGNPRQSWIQNSMLWILDSRFWIRASLSVRLGSEFQLEAGFQIPGAELQISKPMAQLFEGRLALNPGLNLTRVSFFVFKSIFLDNFLCYF